MEKMEKMIINKLPILSKKADLGQSICFIYYNNEEKISAIKFDKYKVESSAIEYNNKKVSFYEIYIKNEYIYNNKIDISLYINKIQYKMQVTDIRYVKNFLFNHKIFNVKTKEENRLNWFDIEDEYNIYYKICSEKKGEEQFPYLNSLHILLADILKSGSIQSSFSLFLKVYMQNSNMDLENCLNKIKIKGNLPKIDESKINNDKIYILYKILSDMESLSTGTNDNLKIILFECLQKYPNIINLIDITKYIPLLLEIAQTFSDLLIILKYIKDIKLFFNLILSHEVKIAKLSKIAKTTIKLDDFFEFNKFNCDDFINLRKNYDCIIKLKRYQEENYKFLSLNSSFKNFVPPEISLLSLEKLIFYYLINHLNEEAIVFLSYNNRISIYSKDASSLSNLELISYAEIMSIVTPKNISSLMNLIYSIDLDLVNKEFLEIFKMININWNDIFEHKDFILIISNKINSINMLNHFLVFFEILEILENKKKFAIYNQILAFINKRILYLFENSEVKLDQKSYEILSHFIYLCDKQSQKCLFFEFINEYTINLLSSPFDT